MLQVPPHSQLLKLQAYSEHHLNLQPQIRSGVHNQHHLVLVPRLNQAHQILSVLPPHLRLLEHLHLLQETHLVLHSPQPLQIHLVQLLLQSSPALLERPLHRLLQIHLVRPHHNRIQLNQILSVPQIHLEELNRAQDLERHRANR